jgi:hypothetical protein
MDVSLTLVAHGALTVGVGGLAIALPEHPNSKRVRAIMIQNKGTGSIFIGRAGVTTVTGFEIAANSSATFQARSDGINAISAADQDVRVLEFA